MIERGLLYQPDMSRAVLREVDPKRQTRRPVKVDAPVLATSAGVFSAPGKDYDGEWIWLGGDPKDIDAMYPIGEPFRCPYGVPGDRLWGRENWRTLARWDDKPPREIPAGEPLLYAADEGKAPLSELRFGRLRPGMFMCRWMSRILLEITNVRVERLQDISEVDARAEGAESRPFAHSLLSSMTLIDWPLMDLECPHRNGYAMLWERINGAGSWDLNPWVWAIDFRRLP